MRARLAPGAGWQAWLAENDGATVGQVWMHVFEKLPNPVDEVEGHAYITNCYVRPEARGSGVGTRLVQAALAACQAFGVDSTILWATPRSRWLYERHGFKAPSAVMERSDRR